MNKKLEKHNRNHTIRFRVTESEYQKILAFTKDLNYSDLSKYLCSAAMFYHAYAKKKNNTQISLDKLVKLPKGPLSKEIVRLPKGPLSKEIVRLPKGPLSKEIVKLPKGPLSKEIVKLPKGPLSEEIQKK